MLELKNIKKNYLSGENTVYALKGIDLKFRSSEFVSILGPSGCGKTTMLNIIGGLDQYTEGDLVINGRSTKDFKDRDWDAYRNNSIGFVFQSYNLIPHQTVLQNVELALTLSGISKTERRERAKKALEEVGLGNQLHKRPSEMSGGQMQRVAIARALINNPDIILADEPTGALDTETSVQVMEILKRISKDRLIIMVTHNPELAEKYSSRIIRMLDGAVKDDSMPLTEEEISKEKEKDDELFKATKGKKVKKPSMSFFTAFSLSLKNLFTKKGRTILTAFAGSIGIIGISLILSISDGLTQYIDDVQENALSSYPLTLEAQSTDLSALMETFMNINKDKAEHEKDAVYKKSAMYDIFNAMNNLEVKENDLKAFKKHLTDKMSDKDGDFYNAINGIKYSYNLNLQVYTKNADGNIIKSDATELMYEMMSEAMGVDMSAMQQSAQGGGSMMSMSSMSMAGSSKLWQELLTGKDGAMINDLIKNQYDMVYGSWPNSYDEIVLVLDKNNELNDIALYALGLESKETMDKIMKAAFEGAEIEKSDKTWSYEEICSKEYSVILNSDSFVKDEATGLYSDLRDTEAGIQYLYDNGIKLRVTGIIRPNEDAEATMLTGSIGYTKALTEYVIENAGKSEVIDAQLASPTIDVTNGLLFKESASKLTNDDKKKLLSDYVNSLDEKGKSELYVKIMSIMDDDALVQAVEAAMKGIKREDIEKTLIGALTQQMSVSAEEVVAYIEKMSDDELKETYKKMVAEQTKAQYEAQIQQQLAAITDAEGAAALIAAINKFTTEQSAKYYDEVMEFSDNKYDTLLNDMGYVDLEKPSAIHLYASSFDNKEIIEDEIADYNNSVDEIYQIQYTDYFGIMMSSVSSIINAITYILVAFVAISLIVSSIMIGVITLISVQERTKEIGILRAIGASKHDVSSMFNAETVIIGFCAGLLGVIVTCILCIPINAIIHSVTGINSLNAALPFGAAIILILISIFLTLVSGIIPSRSAAKKDPVVALRSE